MEGGQLAGDLSSLHLPALPRLEVSGCSAPVMAKGVGLRWMLNKASPGCEGASPNPATQENLTPQWDSPISSGIWVGMGQRHRDSRSRLQPPHL